MGQKSSIETELSDEDRAALNKMIVSGKWTIMGLLEWLGERDYEISRSALGRHKRKVDRVAERMRQSREVTEALTKELGDSALQGKQGRLLVEMTRGLVFDLLDKIHDDDAEGLAPQDVMMLGKGLAELGKALRLDQDFETKIREQVALEERNRAADVAGDAVRAGGASDDDVAFIRSEILGIGKRVARPSDDE